MPREPKQYRLETETIAEIDLYSRLQRLEYTTFVEQAVMERIRQAKKETGIDSLEITRVAGQNGAVLLRLFMMAERKVAALTWTPNEERMRQFVRKHTAFFYSGEDEPRDEAMRFLWPRLEAIMAEWEADYWQPGRTMQDIYRANGIEPPQWPPTGEATSEADSKRTRKKQ